ncbi:porin [Dechloromonas sp. ZS-1]|uniref:porin n=1 Tax=Dechloromonas sp. ZS-1 TaxID=3138067 RepID=UPI0031FD2942
MQKKIIALALAAVAGSAAAQTNVTIYGVADAGFASVSASGAKRTSAIVSGGLSGSRIGFKGTEDLGNGLKALFTLEYGLAIDQNSFIGDQSSNQARQQLVGLTSDKFGTVVAGYLQTAGYDFACATNPLAGGPLDGYTLVSGGSALLSCGAKGRASNAVAYVSPNFGGLTLSYNHARVTEIAGATNTKDIYANLLAASYENGPISAGAIYSKISGNNAGVDLSGDSNTVYQNGVGTSTPGSASFLAKDLVEWGVRGSYNFGVAKLNASYQVADSKATDGKNKKWQVSATVPTTATGAAHVMYAKNKMDENTTSNDGTSAWTLAYTHGLSKRTTLYTGYTRLSNQDNAKLGAFGIYEAGNSNAYVGKDSIAPATGGNSSIFAMGINHKF